MGFSKTSRIGASGKFGAPSTLSIEIFRAIFPGCGSSARAARAIKLISTNAAIRAFRIALLHYSIGFDFDLRGVIDETRDLDHRRRRTNLAEHLAVHAGDRFPF